MSDLSVLVVGMHRSGTSALSRAVAELGVSFGAPSDLLLPGQDNPRGYWERVSIVGLNDAILQHVGWNWESIPASSEQMPPTWSDFLERGRQLISEVNSDELVGFKDPRFSVTLPFWRHVFLDKFVALRIRRDPAEVIWSLHLRNGMSIMSAAALLMAYDRHLDSGLEGIRTLEVTYEALLDRPQDTMTAIRDAIADEGMASFTDDQVVASTGMIEKILARKSVPDWVLKSDFVAKARKSRSDRSSSLLEFRRHVATPTIPEEWEVDTLCGRLENRRQAVKFESVKAELSVAQSEVGQTKSALQSSQERELSLIDQLQGQTQRAGMLTDQFVELTEKYRTSQSEVVDLQRRNTELRLETDRLRRLEEDVLHLRARANRDQNDLRAVKHERDAMLRSFSWRLGRALTYPIRGIRRILKRS